MLHCIQKDPVKLFLLVVYGAPVVIVAHLRLIELSGIPLGLPDLDRVLSGARLPFVAHIVGVIGFNLLGALQFSTQLRSVYPRLHRGIGWCATLAGLSLGLSGLWLSLFFPVADHTTPLFTAFRVIASCVLVAVLVIGLHKAIFRHFRAHRNWMIRAYALALGTTTQGLLTLAWEEAIGPLPDLMHAVVFAAGWGLTLLIAELILVDHAKSEPRPAYA
ncbi:MAG: DUF2306 domain-containing protein [Rhodobacteraceae bacterium]|nr:DUF2306 domain-containing protein [Paracoccaceae bacterium]